ncbi:MAG: antibiotic biosynthesis monooxygenase [Phycisphaerales bacterium]|jgi:quinol monooxygenase YgiN|nr:antibiotic biosynthesis monooxygenase [Phycisphaerales bacterium]
MIHVIAAVELAPGKRDEYLELFAQFIPKVLAENGCIAYGPTIDIDSGFGAQEPLRDNVVTVVEQWSDLDALTAHIQAPHMAEYKEAVKDIVVGLKLQILQPV